MKDAADAYLRSAEALLDRLDAGKTAPEKYAIASDEDPSVMTVAERVRDVVAEETGEEPPVELVENPRGNETLVQEFAVDTTRTRSELGWTPTRSVEDTVRSIVRAR